MEINMDAQAFDIEWLQHSANRVLKSTDDLVIDQDDEEAAQERIDAIEIAESDVGIHDSEDEVNYLVEESEEMQSDDEVDQIAARNLIFMARDCKEVTGIITAREDVNGAVVVSASDGTEIDCEAVMQQVAGISASELTHQHENGDGNCTEEYVNTPQIIMEEVITDDWVHYQNEERVEISADQIISSNSQEMLDIEVPLPTVQDEYTALRPYPCDFCSRRFRKKASLMNHMIAHQNDRPHLCKLCGSRFFRRSDLISHLKAHAEASDDIIFVSESRQAHHQEINDHYYDQDWGIQPESIVIPIKTSRKSQVSENSSSASSSISVARGRISRLKPKKRQFSIENSLKNAPDKEFEEHQNTTESMNVVNTKKTYPVIDDNKPFVCQECGLAFSREKALMAHMKNHRKDSAQECSQCNEIFWKEADLQEHMKTHQFEESNSEYDPEEAEETQSDSEQDIKPSYGEFYCNECGVSFHREDILRRHSKAHKKSMRSHDAADIKGQHCCNNCGETFAEALDLLAHAEIHARYPHFKCVLCGETFFEEAGIKRHLETNHEDEMTMNSCILCGKQCRDRKALIKHAWDHSREKCHLCSKCGKNFHNKARLKRHMASHRDKTVTCDICLEEFPDGRSLSNHRHSHSITSNGKLFPCNECGKTFGSRSSQQIHVRIHTGERPYGCRFCWKAFADGGTLRKHERIHTGEKPYACSVCPRAFNQRVVLREHIRSHHSSIDIKRGTYYCTVCTMELGSSNELIQHLIKHSDTNTAMKRQPIAGPRKYKRRRKLNSRELARLRDSKQNDEDSDIDIDGFDIENVNELLGIDDNETTTATTATTAITTKKEKQKSINNSKQKKDSTSDDGSIVYESTKKTTPSASYRDRSHGAERLNSTSSTDKLWPSKLSNSNQNDDSYRTLFMNIETTLQNIDSLVVSNNNHSKSDTTDSSTAQRTQQVQISKTQESKDQSTTTSRRKATNSKSPTTRPRMIHTGKTNGVHASGSKRRPNTYITRTESVSLKLREKKTTLEDDYEIISPDIKPPYQISSSPMHIKQDQMAKSRNTELYDTHLMFDTSTLRKETYERFNPSIVSDLEEILRSPIKSDKIDGSRHRYISESSTNNFVVEPSEEHNLIKIEPSSPNLHEIVNNNVTPKKITSIVEETHVHATRSRSNGALQGKYLSDFIIETIPSQCIRKGKQRTKNTTSNSRSLLKNKNNTKNEMEKFNKYDVTDGLSSTTESNSKNFFTAKITSSSTKTKTLTEPQQKQKPRHYFECEMCSAAFTDRAQLLLHVPIHI